jgi:hypothetical protein
MPSKSKLIEEARILFADTEDLVLRARYERIIGEFRRLLSEAEKDNAVLREQHDAMAKRLHESANAVANEKALQHEKDNQIAALRHELAEIIAGKGLDEKLKRQKIVGGKPVNMPNPEILGQVPENILDEMILEAVTNYNRGIRSTDVRGFRDEFLIATETGRRFGIIVGRNDVQLEFLDEDKKLEKALRDPRLRKKIDQKNY